MNVGIDKTGNHRAPAEIDDFGGRACEFAKFFRIARRGNVVAFNRERLFHRRGGILGDDLAVDEQQIGGVGGGWRGAGSA